MYVDTVLLVAILKPNDRHKSFSEQIINSKENLYTSAATLIELEIVVKREISDFLSKSILTIIAEKIPRLKIIPFDQKTLQKSLELRKKYELGIYDSIHAATCLLKDKKIASTDHIFDKIPGIERSTDKIDEHNNF